MAGTLNIPLTSLAVGTRKYGPAALANADTLAVVTIDRTVAGGLNATPAASIRLAIEISMDGGATWNEAASEGLPGGTELGHGGAPVTADDIGVSLWPGTGRQVRASTVTSGAAVAVQGSLVIT